MEIEQVIRKLTGGQNIGIDEVPDIELYMDQVVSFIDRRMEHLKRHERDKLMTSTMINNYTKAGLLAAPNKKKYDRNHILALILIYHFKQILSIQDIDYLLRMVLKADQITLPQLYELFLEVKEGDRDWLTRNVESELAGIDRLIEGLPLQDRENMRANLLAMTLVWQADLLKRTAEKLLDLTAGK